MDNRIFLDGSIKVNSTLSNSLDACLQIPPSNTLYGFYKIYNIEYLTGSLSIMRKEKNFIPCNFEIIKKLVNSFIDASIIIKVELQDYLDSGVDINPSAILYGDSQVQQSPYFETDFGIVKDTLLSTVDPFLSYGGFQQLGVGGDYQSLLKISREGLPKKALVKKVELEFTSISYFSDEVIVGLYSTDGLYQTSGNEWDELSTTWASKPLIGNKVLDFKLNPFAKTTVDITEWYFSWNTDTVNFYLISDLDLKENIMLGSRESVDSPKFIISYYIIPDSVGRAVLPAELIVREKVIHNLEAEVNIPGNTKFNYLNSLVLIPKKEDAGTLFGSVGPLRFNPKKFLESTLSIEKKPRENNLFGSIAVKSPIITNNLLSNFIIEEKIDECMLDSSVILSNQYFIDSQFKIIKKFSNKTLDSEVYINYSSFLDSSLIIQNKTDNNFVEGTCFINYVSTLDSILEITKNSNWNLEAELSISHRISNFLNSNLIIAGDLKREHFLEGSVIVPQRFYCKNSLFGETSISYKNDAHYLNSEVILPNLDTLEGSISVLYKEGIETLLGDLSIRANKLNYLYSSVDISNREYLNGELSVIYSSYLEGSVLCISPYLEASCFVVVKTKEELEASVNVRPYKAGFLFGSFDLKELREHLLPSQFTILPSKDSIPFVTIHKLTRDYLLSGDSIAVTFSFTLNTSMHRVVFGGTSFDTGNIFVESTNNLGKGYPVTYLISYDDIKNFGETEVNIYGFANGVWTPYKMEF